MKRYKVNKYGICTNPDHVLVVPGSLTAEVSTYVAINIGKVKGKFTFGFYTG